VNLRQLRFLWLALGMMGLLFVYLFQKENPAQVLGFLLGTSSLNANLEFAVNRTLRLLLNDAFCMLIIYALFRERAYVSLAFLLFCFELVVLLPVYLVIKLSLEGPSEISSPLLSYIHRLIVNPLLMFILMAGFYYQNYFHSSGK
jgi:exosortase F-associated protein